MLKIILTIVFLLSPVVSLAQQNQTFDFGYREDEPERLAASNGFAQRKGNTLILSFDGKPVVRLKDYTPGNCRKKHCHIWTYFGTWQLKPSPDAEPEPHAIISYYPGYVSRFIIVDKKGNLVWLDANIGYSPDGRYITDSAILNYHGPKQFHLIDWTSADHATAWASPFPCENPEWTGPSSFYVACDNPKLKLRSFAEVRLMPDGNWNLRELGQLPKDVWVLGEFVADGAKFEPVPAKHLRSVNFEPIAFTGQPLPFLSLEEITRSVTVVKPEKG